MSNASASDTIPGFTADYDVEYSGTRVIQSVISLQRSGSQLNYQSRSKPVGLAKLLFKKHRVTETSLLQEDGDQIRPLEYSYKLVGGDDANNIYYRFDWENNKVDITNKGEQKTLNLPQGTMDNFSLQLALMQDSSNGTERVDYHVLSKGNLKTYRFTNIGEEILDTPLGQFKTVKLQRKKNNKKKTVYIGWYAEELNYLPVKIEKQERGETVMSMLLTKVSWQ